MLISLFLLDSSAALMFIITLDYIYRTRRARRPAPPGPKGWPLIGNLLDMPTSHEWKTFTTWGDKWGGIMSVSLFGQRIVILNTPQYAYEMFEKKSNIYSDRPVLMMGGKLVGWDRTLALSRYGPKLRHTRRLFSQYIGSRSHINKHSPHLENEVQQFLVRLRHQPGAVVEHVRRLTAAMILKMAYGYQVEDDDVLIRIVDRAVEEFSLSTAPGAFLVDTFPLLENVPTWMPGAGWKKKVRAWARDLDVMCDMPYEFTKKQMVNALALRESVYVLMVTLRRRMASLYQAFCLRSSRILRQKMSL